MRFYLELGLVKVFPAQNGPWARFPPSGAFRSRKLAVGRDARAEHFWLRRISRPEHFRHG